MVAIDLPLHDIHHVVAFHRADWWKWSTDPSPWSDDGAAGNDKAPENNSDFEPQHKPAQEVLTKFYRGGCPKTLF